jgi:AhpD family alkylhydroperoxidase
VARRDQKAIEAAVGKVVQLKISPQKLGDVLALNLLNGGGPATTYARKAVEHFLVLRPELAPELPRKPGKGDPPPHIVAWHYLSKKLAPRGVAGFNELHHAFEKQPGLPRAVKELVALALGVKAGCADCIKSHSNAARKHKASKEQLEAAKKLGELSSGAAIPADAKLDGKTAALIQLSLAVFEAAVPADSRSAQREEAIISALSRATKAGATPSEIAGAMASNALMMGRPAYGVADRVLTRVTAGQQ